MESLSETKWDVLIEGTGLQNSLLALALSRNKKNILHVDANEYYGDMEAAFSLQEAEEWVKRFEGKETSSTNAFRNAVLWKSDEEKQKLSFSRAYTLTLAPQIIYTKSQLLAQLISSKVYRQLEFQAVGNWWIYDTESEQPLKRLPNGREDIFQDKSIDNRAKRGLMKFLKFVVDYENQTETWEAHAESDLAGFLSLQFQLPQNLQSVIAALTLSLDPPDKTPVRWALPRIARHLTCIGVFGPGFGSVVSKWGGGAEIAQVACRSGAVGGAVYMLGTGVTASEIVIEEDEQLISVHLSNDESVLTRHLVGGTKGSKSVSTMAVSKVIAVVSAPLLSLFQRTVEGAPLAAVSVIAIPANTITSQTHPMYIMAHSSETGECPDGQCVIYATTSCSAGSKAVLETGLKMFLETPENGEGKVLYNLYYEQEQVESSIDLAFNDTILEDVEKQWREIVGSEETTAFMQFEDREGMSNDDDDDDGY